MPLTNLVQFPDSATRRGRRIASTATVPSRREREEEIRSVFGYFHFVGRPPGEPAVFYRALSPTGIRQARDAARRRGPNSGSEGQRTAMMPKTRAA